MSKNGNEVKWISCWYLLILWRKYFTSDFSLFFHPLYDMYDDDIPQLAQVCVYFCKYFFRFNFFFHHHNNTIFVCLFCCHFDDGDEWQWWVWWMIISSWQCSYVKPRDKINFSVLFLKLFFIDMKISLDKFSGLFYDRYLMKKSDRERSEVFTINIIFSPEIRLKCFSFSLNLV